MALLTALNSFELNKHSNNKGSAGVLLSLIYCWIMINDGETGMYSTGNHRLNAAVMQFHNKVENSDKLKLI